MRVTLRRLAGLTAGYSLVTFLGPLFTILLTPVYTRALEPSDYGVMDVTLTLGAVINMLVLLGLDQALSAYFFTVNEDQRRDLITTTALYVLATSVFMALLISIMSPQIAELLFNDPSRAVTIKFLSLQIASAPAYLVAASSLRLGMSIRRVNILGLAYLFSLVSLNLLFIVVLQFKATGAIAASAFAYLIGCIAGIALIWQTYRGHFSLSWFRKVWRTGVAIVPSVAGFLILSNIDRLMLTQYVSTNDIGIYSIANKLAAIVYVILFAVWSAWWPLALELANKPDAKQQFARFFEYFVCGSMILALAIGLSAPELLRIFTQEAYAPAAPYVLLLTVYAGPIAIASSSFQIGIYANNRVHLTSVAYLIAATINIVLNIVLMPAWGILGAVIATLIAGNVLIVVLYHFSQRTLHIHYRLGRIFMLSAIYTFIVVGFAVPTVFQYQVLPRIFVFVAFVLLLFILGIVRRDQIHALVQSARRQLMH